MHWTHSQVAARRARGESIHCITYGILCGNNERDAWCEVEKRRGVGVQRT